jgi:hypothetical protein
MDYRSFHERTWRDGARPSRLRPGQVAVHDHDGNHDLYDLRGLGAGVFTKFARWFEAVADVSLTVERGTRGADMFSEPFDHEEDEGTISAPHGHICGGCQATMELCPDPEDEGQCERPRHGILCANCDEEE